MIVIAVLIKKLYPISFIEFIMACIMSIIGCLMFILSPPLFNR